MSAGIFLIRDDNELLELAPSPYDSEDLLQSLLARHPNLLAGDQMDREAPRRWLLVTREAAVPAIQDGPGRWSLDHLFLDQEGVPTLVEVKRSSDSRIRREVVGQMLDYAANGVAYWPIESVRAMYESRCHDAGEDPIATLSSFVGADGDPERFWTAVKDNLQIGRIRMVFVADEIPPELRRIVEFLNTQMDPAEVLAVEVRQYVGGAFRGLVPRLLGQTEQANRRKTAGVTTPSRSWDEESILGELRERGFVREAAVTQRLLRWAHDRNAVLWFGSGSRSGSIYVNLNPGVPRSWPFAIWTYGKIEMQFQSLMLQPAFASEESRAQLQERLNRIAGVAVGADSLTKRPSFSIALLDNDQSFAAFTSAMAWVADALASQAKA